MRDTMKRELRTEDDIIQVNNMLSSWKGKLEKLIEPI